MNDSGVLSERILDATLTLLRRGGRNAVTTRAVAALARVQAPTIYRVFGNMHTLLIMAASAGYHAYLDREVRRTPSADSLKEFRDAWDLNIEFGLNNPALFAIMAGNPLSGELTQIPWAGLEVLRRHVRRLAAGGLLRLAEEEAIALTRAAGTGTVLMLLERPPGERDAELALIAREAVVSAIITRSSRTASSAASIVVENTAAAAAVTLHVQLNNAEITGVLSAGERHLMAELLTRIAGSANQAAAAATRALP